MKFKMVIQYRIENEFGMVKEKNVFNLLFNNLKEAQKIQSFIHNHYADLSKYNVKFIFKNRYDAKFKSIDKINKDIISIEYSIYPSE